ncbi:MAG: hypothetical protein A2Y87_10055 [Bacteroidetes bacterium RBG_13_46_8]|nr:MAG: hypothetical protein A2Y87_10055 [Bacteroidetes bacterium RBG_13_46_8]
MDDIVELIIYIAIGVVGLLASAYRSKLKRKEHANRIPRRDIASESLPDVQPDLGPLAEIFGFPETVSPKPLEVTVTEEPTIEEEGYRMEEEGFLLDRPEPETIPEHMLRTSEAEQEGLEAEKTGYEGVPVFKSTAELLISDSISDSAISDSEGIYESISASEIKGVEEMEKRVDNEGINWRKAVIYSEILQRKGK